MGKIERYKGCLLGLAIGDALGTTLEFQRPGSFEPVTDMIGGGPFNLAPGQWTDDTSMALCLSESLIACKGIDLKDQMERYLHWYREGHLSSTDRCFDIGHTVHNALLRFEKTGDPRSGSTEERSAGNGSIMRLAPVPMFYANKPLEALEKSGESSITTYALKICVDACRYFGGLIVAALNGAAKGDILLERYRPDGRKWSELELAPEIDEVASGTFMEAALWSFYKSDSFRDGCLMAVNLGNDADTTGAVYGQLAGAYYGTQSIQEEWLAKLARHRLIEEFAEGIYEFSKGAR